MLFFLLKIVLFRVLRSAYHKSELAGWTKAFLKNELNIFWDFVRETYLCRTHVLVIDFWSGWKILIKSGILSASRLILSQLWQMYTL